MSSYFSPFSLGTAKRWNSSADDGSKKIVAGRLHSLLRFAGFSAALVMAGGGICVITWPLIDAKGLPWCYKRALQVSGPDTIPKRQSPYDEAAIAEIRQLFENDEESNIVVVSAPAMSGKTSLVSYLSEDHPIAYLNFRGVHDGATYLYATLSTLLVPTLGLGGQMVVAYHKLFNMLFEGLTMAQQHEHVSYIIYCQVTQHLRAACYMLQQDRLAYQQSAVEGNIEQKGDKSSTTIAMNSVNASGQRDTRIGSPSLSFWDRYFAPLPPRKKPIIVIDATEAMVEMLNTVGMDSQAALFPLLTANLTLRSAVDEGICHALFLVDSRALMGDEELRRCFNMVSQKDSAPSGQALSFLFCFPQLAQRARFRYLRPPEPPREWELGFEEVLQTEGQRPFLMGEILGRLQEKPSSTPESTHTQKSKRSKSTTIAATKQDLTIGALAKDLGVSQASVAESLGALMECGLVTPALGSRLGDRVKPSQKRSSSSSSHQLQPRQIRSRHSRTPVFKFTAPYYAPYDSLMGRVQLDIMLQGEPRDTIGRRFYRSLSWGDVHGYSTFWRFIITRLWMKDGFYWLRAATQSDGVVAEDYTSFLEMKNGDVLVPAGPSVLQFVRSWL